MKFIAEISSNHEKDLRRAKELIATAKSSGFDAVKFQLFKIDELFAPEVLLNSSSHRERRNWELPIEWLPELKATCDEFDIEFGITPFYLKAVAESLPYVDFFKIASYELTWHRLIHEAASTKKPIYISSGMANLEEIQSGIDVAKNTGNLNIHAMHCVSRYPAEGATLNLSAIETMRHRLGVPVGWSDHSCSISAIVSSVLRWNADCIEMHIDLDGTGSEFAPGHCWLPRDAENAISLCKHAVEMDGDGTKAPSVCEQEERSWRADPSDGLRPFLAVRSGLK